MDTAFEADVAAASAAASASGLAVFAAGRAQTIGQVGPCLTVGMGEAATVASLNAWGAARDSELIQLRLVVAAHAGELAQLRGDLGTTQTVVASAFEQAKAQLQAIVDSFRVEAAKLRYDGEVSAAQALSNLEQVVGEARARFDAQDALVAQGLGELAQRLQRVDAWAQAEPARVAALVQAAPAQQRWRRSPGGTTLQQEPPPVPSTPPRASDGAWAAYQASPPDPWAAAAAAARTGPPVPGTWAAAAAAADASQTQPGGPRHHEMNTPGYTGGGGYAGGGGKGGAPYPREMRIDARGWASENKKLDITTSFDAFQIWKDRAMMFLSRERPDVRKLLVWAETQTMETLAAGLVAQAAHCGVPDLAGVEYAIHDGIKMTILDSLLGRARNCVERGCELWRSLCAEWSGAAPQLQHAKACRYQAPARCKTVQELWSRLPAWERLGEEVVLSGFVVPPWLACSALEQLLPTQLRDALVARASCGDELKTFAQRLAWVKTQMEYARGQAQATAYAPGSKDASGDVNMYSVEGPADDAPDAIEGMTWALAEATHAGEWELAETLTASIFALKGSKGGFRKGLGKGKPAAKGAGAAVPFKGACRHCNIWGHRMQDCKRLTRELAEKGGGKGKGKAGKGSAGGKGGPKGGKGPLADPLLEVGAGADDNWAGDLLDGAIDAAAAELDEWALGGAIYSVTAAPCTAAASASSRLVPAGLTQTHKQHKTFAVQPAPYKTFIAAASSSSLAPYKTFSSTAAAASASSRLAPYKTFLERPYKTFAGGVVAALAAGAQTKTQNSFAALSLLTDDAEELLAAVSGDARGGRVVEAVVDSGAVHSVTPPGLFPGPTVPSPWSRAGRGYRAANGTGIKNLGQVAVKFCTAEGDRCSIPFQVAEVDQPLLSVAHLTSAGNRVELGHASGRVVNLTTGRAIALERRGGVYIMRMFVANGVAPAPAPFRRQGA